MLPELFSIGPLTVHSYGLLVALGFLTGIIITVRIGRTEGINPQLIMDLTFILVVSAIAGSRILYVLINLSHYKTNPLDIFKIWEGGLVFSGGVTVAALSLVWYAKRKSLNLLKTADLFAPGVAVGQAIGRLGCLMAGCCYGVVTDEPWSIIFTHPKSLAPLNIPLHPTQIYSSVIGACIFLVLFILYRYRKYDGQVALWFLILHSTARLFVERFRGDDRGLVTEGMTATQFLSLLILIFSVIALTVLKKRAKKASPDGRNHS
ncbi:MAG: prolipoprotein diacylglyceryl transferase [Desulfobacteraceae bacterium]|nr:MAG: prolipoprotein diacylglyceryl transferase [Desulfobacteraceae bacterium]